MMINRVRILLAGVVMLLAPPARAEDADELKRLREKVQHLEARLKLLEKENEQLRKERDANRAVEGNWVVESAFVDGREANYLKGQRWTVRGGLIEVVSPQGQEFAPVTYRLDTSTTPKSIDWSFRWACGNTPAHHYGRYALKEDRLIVCLPTEGARRPAKLEEGPGSKCTVYSLRRAK